MNIEDKLNELGQELQYVPENMEMAGMKKSMTRRRNIHRAAVAGRSVLIALASLFLVLFIGVNTSVKFARAASDMPVIGTISKSIIIRDDIREALDVHEDLIPAIEAGQLIDVGITVDGKNNPIRLTFDSILVDEHAINAILKVDTEMLPQGFYTIQNLRVTDLSTGEEIPCLLENTIIDLSRKPFTNRFFWEHPCTDFALDFDLVDEAIDYTSWNVLESYHFEFTDVTYPETHHIPIDQTISFEGFDFHFVELQVSATGTKVIYEMPEDPSISCYFLSMYIDDGKGHILAEPVSDSFLSYSRYTENGKKYEEHLLSSFYYEKYDRIVLHITECYCSFFDEEVVTLDPIALTVSYKDKVLPCQVFLPEGYDQILGLPEDLGRYSSLTEFGLSAEYDKDNDWQPEYAMVLMIPVTEDLPAINSQRYYEDGIRTSYCREYPRTTIDGQEYIVIKQFAWDKDEHDYRFYFLEGTPEDTYEVDYSITIGY